MRGADGQVAARWKEDTATRKMRIDLRNRDAEAAEEEEEEEEQTTEMVGEKDNVENEDSAGAAADETDGKAEATAARFERRETGEAQEGEGRIWTLLRGRRRSMDGERQYLGEVEEEAVVQKRATSVLQTQREGGREGGKGGGGGG